MISIIVPVYNAEKTLNRCVDSILSQSYTDFELLLIDDGSIDGSGELCDEYACLDTRVKTTHKVNNGVSSARNLGLLISKGNCIAFIDADDYVDKNYLRDMFTYDTDLVVCGYRSSYGRVYTPELVCWDLSVIKQNVEKLFKSDCVFTPWAKMFKKSIIEQNELIFDESLRLTEDAAFVHEYISYCKSIQFVNNNSYFYDGHWGGFTKYDLSWNDVKQITYKHLSCLKKVGKAFDAPDLYRTHFIKPRYQQVLDLYNSTTASECYELYRSGIDNMTRQEFFNRILPMTLATEKIVDSISTHSFFKFCVSYRHFVDVPSDNYKIEGRLNRLCSAMALNRLYFLYPIAVLMVLCHKFMQR